MNDGLLSKMVAETQHVYLLIKANKKKMVELYAI